MPLGHLGVNVSDLDKARSYYDELLPKLGFEPFVSGPSEFSYRPADGKVGTVLFFYQALEPADYSRHRVGLQHMAFMVPTRDEVAAIHDWARARGDEIIEPPQEFPQYHPGYYAVFFRGPDGFVLEVVCHKG
ncbi:VOC family protein [Nocardia sp. NPDC051832]|uniref:VOC family protein n=1 Tax=Nocardia sp. NPDC051832 TaxID=3155673 RepID=UPI00341AA0F6